MKEEKNLELKNSYDYDEFDRLKQEAKTDINKAIDLYRSFVGKAETMEEKIKRINKFRCG